MCEILCVCFVGISVLSSDLLLNLSRVVCVDDVDIVVRGVSLLQRMCGFHNL